MDSRADLESQNPFPQLHSPHDSDTDEEPKPTPLSSPGYALPFWRKCLILFVVSWMTLSVTFSSTSLLPATPEIAAEFATSTEILNVVNAGVLIAMGLSSFIWGPMANIVGRRMAYNMAIVVLCGCSVGMAAAINLHMFIAMRLLSGFTGTFFMVAGQTIIADIFEPHLTCGLLATFQYAILTSARSIFNPRFNLTTPLVSGLFYLSPGIGFLIGSVVGGKLSDRAVKKWIVNRNGVRLPQDRLNSGLATLFLVLPASTLIYAWTLQEEVEVMPQMRSEVISGKYLVQYLFGAAATASVEPLINSIGVGWTFSICESDYQPKRPRSSLMRIVGVAFAVIGGVLVWIITKWGINMQRWVEKKLGEEAKPT
ncbi:MFS transporter [Penicillium argentinense]|uniref:MFS transporter n=1 Tax=Penicillium argentinense TaxID=1131581 RepID=A0A9W9FM76_9EURO|nr:MFS transporter [Penicillium argentinense]KAJ5102708.1 MFS transporter [Penicillium argentinense]